MQRILICTGILGEGNALAFGAADILMSTMVRLQADVPVALPAREEAH
jgi:hypothetical protein